MASKKFIYYGSQRVLRELHASVNEGLVQVDVTLVHIQRQISVTLGDYPGANLPREKQERPVGLAGRAIALAMDATYFLCVFMLFVSLVHAVTDFDLHHFDSLAAFTTGVLQAAPGHLSQALWHCVHDLVELGMAWLVICVGLCLLVLLPGFCFARGQTIGQFFLGQVTVSHTGASSHASFWRALLAAVANMALSPALPLLLVLDGGRTLGDVLSGTRVVLRHEHTKPATEESVANMRAQAEPASIAALVHRPRQVQDLVPALLYAAAAAFWYMYVYRVTRDEPLQVYGYERHLRVVSIACEDWDVTLFSFAAAAVAAFGFFTAGVFVLRTFLVQLCWLFYALSTILSVSIIVVPAVHGEMGVAFVVMGVTIFFGALIMDNMNSIKATLTCLSEAVKGLSSHWLALFHVPILEVFFQYIQFHIMHSYAILLLSRTDIPNRELLTAFTVLFLWWTLFTLRSLVTMTVANMLGKWYFRSAATPAMSSSRFLQALTESYVYQFGTAAFAGMFLMLAHVIQHVADRVLKAERDTPWVMFPLKLALWVTAYLFHALAAWLEMMTSYAVTYAGLTGSAMLPSGGFALTLMGQKFSLAVVAGSVVNSVVSLLSLFFIVVELAVFMVLQKLGQASEMSDAMLAVVVPFVYMQLVIAWYVQEGYRSLLICGLDELHWHNHAATQNKPYAWHNGRLGETLRTAIATPPMPWFSAAFVRRLGLRALFVVIACVVVQNCGSGASPVHPTVVAGGMTALSFYVMQY